ALQPLPDRGPGSHRDAAGAGHADVAAGARQSRREPDVRRARCVRIRAAQEQRAGDALPQAGLRPARFGSRRQRGDLMAKAPIALLTDFGTRDHYVGVMKGVMLGINPDATLVDLTHDLPPHDVAAAAHELAVTYRYFPAGTIFLVVVDPGVGSARRGIAAEAGDWRFVAPDNGVLTVVFQEVPPRRVVELSERRYARPTVSRTFEGRDRFAPAAAWLSRGVHVTALGRPVSDYVRLDLPAPHVEETRLSGVVARVDRFGNLITNLDRKACERLTEGVGVLRLTVAGQPIDRIVSTYSDIGADEVAALFGSTDHLEIAMRARRADERLGVGVGADVELVRV